MVLVSNGTIDLPRLSIEVTPGGDLQAASTASIRTRIETRENFQIAGDLKVSFNTHLGWKVGPQVSMPLPAQPESNPVLTEHSFPVPDNCWIANASAGVAVRHGKFMFRIHDQKFLFRGDWARDIARK